MAVLIVGLVVFLGVHSVGIFAPEVRMRGLRSLGEGGWKASYALVSLIGFAFIIYGFGLARQSPVLLYAPPHWMRHVTFLFMLPVFPLILAAYLPGRIKAAMKHPMLAAVLLFGGFLAWAVMDRISLKRRPQALRTAPPGRFNDLIAVVLGLALYALFIGWAHVRLFGVSPL